MSSAMFLTKTLRTSFLSMALSIEGITDTRCMAEALASICCRDARIVAGALMICV